MVPAERQDTPHAAVGETSLIVAGKTLAAAGGATAAYGMLTTGVGASNFVETFNKVVSGDGGSGSGGSPNLNQVKREIEKGQAPKGITRVDKGGSETKEQPHVHFDNGSVLRFDGTWRGGKKTTLTNKQKK